MFLFLVMMIIETWKFKFSKLFFINFISWLIFLFFFYQPCYTHTLHALKYFWDFRNHPNSLSLSLSRSKKQKLFPREFWEFRTFIVSACTTTNRKFLSEWFFFFEHKSQLRDEAREVKKKKLFSLSMQHNRVLVYRLIRVSIFNRNGAIYYQM